LPWKGRTAIGFRSDGSARIDNLQASSHVDFSGGLRIPVRDLNGWPDGNSVTALTRRFRAFYTLRSGEIGIVVKDGKVVSKPGGGGISVPENGFALIANGGAKPWLNKVQRGEGASLSIKAIGWNGITSALGGGPRLVNNSRVEVTALREDFRADVRVGLGPRTAIGIDKAGRYILAVVDGRQKFHSTGLTLTELAYTMQKLGAVDAMNLDGGGSTALAVRGKVVNRPSDGSERSVSNALLVMR
jgi:exopolysaccharide biosynthesis protein